MVVVRKLKFLVLAILFSSCWINDDDSRDPSGSKAAPPTDKERIWIEGTVSGEVTNRETGFPLSAVDIGYNVYLRRPYPPYLDEFLITSVFPGLTSTRTGSNGIYSLKFDGVTELTTRDTVLFTIDILMKKDGFEDERVLRFVEAIKPFLSDSVKPNYTINASLEPL
jgi:hypothetical protein